MSELQKQELEQADALDLRDCLSVAIDEVALLPNERVIYFALDGANILDRPTTTILDVVSACQGLTTALIEARLSLRELGRILEANRERWLCEGEGQWPDKFTLLNRYVRVGVEPEFIFNN